MIGAASNTSEVIQGELVDFDDQDQLELMQGALHTLPGLRSDWLRHMEAKTAAAEQGTARTPHATPFEGRRSVGNIMGISVTIIEY